MKKVRDTKLGAWLKEKAPLIFDVVADALPDSGLLGVVKNLVDKDAGLTTENKLEFKKLEQQERIALEKNITDRWVADVQSQSWMSRNVRPAIVAFLTSFLIVFVLLDTLSIQYEIRDVWVRLYETILVTTIGGYFVVRTVDKRKIK